MTLMEERDLVVEAAKNNLFVIKSLPHLALERRKFKKKSLILASNYIVQSLFQSIFLNVIRLLHENDIFGFYFNLGLSYFLRDGGK